MLVEIKFTKDVWPVAAGPEPRGEDRLRTASAHADGLDVVPPTRAVVVRREDISGAADEKIWPLAVRVGVGEVITLGHVSRVFTGDDAEDGIERHCIALLLRVGGDSLEEA